MQNSIDFSVADDHDRHNTSAINTAHSESDLLQHLCTCQEQDYNWCLFWLYACQLAVSSPF